MNIKIIFSGPYPQGMALSNRIHLYAKGIFASGHQVSILIPNPTEKYGYKLINKDPIGTYEGIDFIYTAGTTRQSKYFLKKLFDVLKGNMKAGRILIKERKNTDALLLVSNALYHILFYKILTWIPGIKYLQEKSELPFINRRMNFISKIYSFFYIKYVYKCFDGMLVISEHLYEYFKPRVRKNCGLLIVPIIVDPEEFISLEAKKTNPGRSIVYAGTLCERKDGVLTLIKAFESIAKKYKDIKLYIIGETTKTVDLQKINVQVNQLNLGDRVILTGFVTRERLVELFTNGTILALAKPSGRQAESCLPSKIAEYLAAGKPVVVTKLGSIPQYLTGRVNVFLAEPDSPEAFAREMDFILSHPEIAEKVGSHGRELALTEFNYRTQAKRIVQFIESL